ncbi:MAG: Maf family protein [Alphaproteobacteria bacterium]|nr:Maf family protein [Alphaproteobacteria bacterium]MBL6938993.1 Maf family protein [Alphaproteobacteria bacterium]MBL7099585.1 Maf family protein [Alphaproteobacteria bacterium]
MNIILASSSKSRSRVLAAAGVPFTVVPSTIDETILKDTLLRQHTPLDKIAGALADAKALSVSQAHPKALVLGGDQTLLFDGELVSKSQDIAAARVLLARLRGKEHRLIGGLTLAHDNKILWRHGESAELWMRHFSDAFLERYLKTEGTSILSAVGCYKLEGLGVQLFHRITGDYFSILGLPLLPLLAELRKQGVIPK